MNNIHSAGRWQASGEVQAPLPVSSESPSYALISSFVKFELINWGYIIGLLSTE